MVLSTEYLKMRISSSPSPDIKSDSHSHPIPPSSSAPILYTGQSLDELMEFDEVIENRHTNGLLHNDSSEFKIVLSITR